MSEPRQPDESASPIQLTVVIPAYNEAARIPETVRAIDETLPSLFTASEIVLVDDGSTDHTAAIVQTLSPSAKTPIRIVRHSHNQGKGAAVRSGVAASIGEWVLIMDADNATPITELPRLWQCKDQAPIVLGSRYLPGSDIRRAQPLLRRIISRGGNLLIRILTGLRLTDTQNGFKLFEGKLARAIFTKATIDRWGFDIEILALAQQRSLPILEVPVAWTDAAGSKLRAGRDAWRTLRELWKIRSNIESGLYRRTGITSTG